jgi:predicted DsbA family dithiol-disulfide isomerase
VKLNLEQFNSCLDEQKYLQRVLDLHQFGREIGIDATPSFLIFNDEKVIKIRGNQPIEVFIRTIEGL